LVGSKSRAGTETTAVDITIGNVCNLGYGYPVEFFVGRDEDTARLAAELEEVRRTGTGRFVWVRGRRRVGKSRLLQEFCDASGLPYCFYQAIQRARPAALAEFGEAVAQSTLDAAQTFAGAAFASWPAALRAACAGATQECPAILVIDELPYLTERDDGFPSDLQKAWDRGIERMPVLLLCVGSDVRMMEQLVRERSPLHGRPTLELAVQPLPLPAVARITGARDSREAIDRYLVVGGFPLLAARWSRGSSMEEFLESALVDDHAFVTTALRIMASEFENALSARQVIEAIGHGETARGKIGDRAGVKGNTLDDALKTLIDAKRMVERRTPYAVPAGTKFARYTIVDSYLRFWLRFVGPHLAEIARGRGDITEARILRDWATYRGRAVEPIVRSALERRLLDPATAAAVGDAAFVGSYWTRDGRVEVDLVGGDALEPKRLAFIGSIKWHERERFSARERRGLVEHRAAVPGAADARLVIVSRTGVEDDVEADLILGPDEIVAAWD
jgi:AAA+ ATPase superfamily predicted ATPase